MPHDTAPRGGRVLVCDDAPDVCEMLAEYLRLRGFEVDTVADAAGLQAALAGGGVDLVLLDVNLHRRNGLAALRALHGGGHAVPVLLLTARAEAVDRLFGIEFGAERYLAKPVNLRELETRIAAALRSERIPPFQVPRQSSAASIG